MRHGMVKRTRFLVSLLRHRMVHMNFQLLYACNFRCGICDFWKSSYAQIPPITVPQVGLIVEKLKPWGPMIVSIGGGEPLLHPDLEEITRLLARDHFPVMISNGSYITPDKARRLFRAGMEEISVSLDYICPEKHDEQRGVEGAFQRAVEALKVLNQNRSARHQRVIMITVVMDDNLDDIEPLILLAGKLGIFYNVTLYSTSRGQKEARVPLKEVGKHLARLQKKYPHFISLPGYIERFGEASAYQKGIAPCYAGRNLFHLDCRGHVTPCIDFVDTPVGNIFSDSLAVLQQRLEQQRCQNTCGQCWTSCRGSIETLMYGSKPWLNWAHSVKYIKPVPLVK